MECTMRLKHFLLTAGLINLLAFSGIASDDFFEMSLDELTEIDVTSVSKKTEKLSESAAAVYVINKEDIKRSGANHIAELLRLAPGVQVAQIDANKWAISIRGNNRQFSNKLLVMIDGRTVYTPLFSGVFWDAQDVVLDDIERIEVIRGPGGTVWGANAVNGVINIMTKHAKSAQGAYANISYGNEEGIAEARYGTKVGENTHMRGYVKYRNHDDFVRPNNIDSQDDWENSRAGFRIDSGNDEMAVKVHGDVYKGQTDQVFDRAPALTPPFTNILNDDTEYNGANILAKVEKQHESGKFSGQIYYDYLDRDISFIGIKRHTADVEFQHDVKPIKIGSLEQEITWGLGYRYISDDLTDSAYIDYVDNDREDHLFSGFIEDKITIVPEKLSVTLGTKVEYNDYTGTEIQPNIRGHYKINDNNHVWAAVSRAVRTPSRNEEDPLTLLGAGFPAGFMGAPIAGFVTQSGNPNMEAEELIAYESGYRTRPLDNVSLDAAVFYHDYDTLRTFEAGTPAPAFSPVFGGYLQVPYIVDNKGSGTSYGAELSGTWNVTDRWRLQGSYTYLETDLELDSGSTDIFLTDDEGRNPEHQVTLRSQLNLPHDVELDNTVYYVDELDNVDDYVRVDARLGWQATPNIQVNAIGRNLFDSEHLEFNEAIYGQPSEVERTYLGNVKVQF